MLPADNPTMPIHLRYEGLCSVVASNPRATGRLPGGACGARENESSYVSRVEQGDVAPSLERAARLLRCLGHELDLEARPMGMRDPEGLPESLAMTRRERMIAMAELHNGITGLQEGRRPG